MICRQCGASYADDVSVCPVCQTPAPRRNPWLEAFPVGDTLTAPLASNPWANYESEPITPPTSLDVSTIPVAPPSAASPTPDVTPEPPLPHGSWPADPVHGSDATDLPSVPDPVADGFQGPDTSDLPPTLRDDTMPYDHSPISADPTPPPPDQGMEWEPIAAAPIPESFFRASVAPPLTLDSIMRTDSQPIADAPDDGDAYGSPVQPTPASDHPAPTPSIDRPATPAPSLDPPAAPPVGPPGPEPLGVPHAVPPIPPPPPVPAPPVPPTPASWTPVPVPPPPVWPPDLSTPPAPPADLSSLEPDSEAASAVVSDRSDSGFAPLGGAPSEAVHPDWALATPETPGQPSASLVPPSPLNAPAANEPTMAVPMGDRMDDAGALFDPDSLFRPVPAVPVDLAPPVAPGEPVPVSLPSDPAHHDSAEPTGLAGLGQMVHEADPADGSHAAAQRDQMSMKIVLFIALGMALVVVIAVLLILL